MNARMPIISIPVPEAPRWHRLIIGIIQRLPAGQLFAYRAYRKLSGLLRAEAVAHTYFGASIACELNDLISSCIYHFGVWEPHISSVVQERLQPGDVFCDVGANIGYDSLLASHLVGNGGRVIAVEPSPSTFKKLTRNLKLNGAANVRTVMAAVTATRCTVPLYFGLPGNAGMASVIDHHGSVQECEAAGLPLADILSAEEFAKLRLLKIDVEGAEIPILHGLIDVLDRCSAEMEVLVELSAPARAERVEIFERFARNGFLPYVVPNSYEIVETYLRFNGPKRPVRLETPPDGQHDILFTRRPL